jgi:glycosyltransferase involved in cell wall biosynthesis
MTPSAVGAVTVVVPTRNRRPILALTLGSVLAQRDVDLHVVVVDEGSSDDTPAYLAAVAGDRLTVVRHDEPKGLAAARNAGLARAETEWVAFCDDDDVWAPDKVAAQLAEIDRVPGAEWACTGTASVNADLEIVGHHRPPPSGDVHDLMRATNVIPGGGSSVLARTAVARRLGGYDAWATGCEDFDFHCRLSAMAPVASVDRPLVGYRVAAGSMSTNVDKMRTGHLRVIERHRNGLDGPMVRQADVRAEQYWARFTLRNRDRLGTLKAYLAIAARHRLPGQALYGIAGALAPVAVDRHQAKLERRRVPEEWAAAARVWLDRLEALEPLPA